MPTDNTNDKSCLDYPKERTPWEKLEPVLVEALTQLHDSESKLFQIAANERTIVGHLACYLRNGKQRLEHDWHIDTDYNRVLGNGRSKRQPFQDLKEAVDTLKKQSVTATAFGKYLDAFNEPDFEKAKDEFEEDTKTNKLTTPDLVIHERTCLKIEHNLLAVEFKPTNTKNHLAIVDLARMLVFSQNKLVQDNNKMPTYQHTLFLYPNQHQGFSGWRFENSEEDNPGVSEAQLFQVETD